MYRYRELKELLTMTIIIWVKLQLCIIELAAFNNSYIYTIRNFETFNLHVSHSGIRYSDVQGGEICLN